MMNKFITRPGIVFEYKKDKDKFYSLKYKLEYIDKDKIYTINPASPGGTFFFNLASVPWYLRWIYKPTQKETFYPSILHDYFYGSKETKRLQDDLLFLRATKSEQEYYLEKHLVHYKFLVKSKYFIIRWTMFILLRSFGWLNKAK